MNIFSNSKKINTGFTLIELLVVVGIISLLSSIISSNINEARKKARDVRRIQDLRQIQTALEMYRDDYGEYPSSASLCDSSWCNSHEDNWKEDLEPVLNKYISALPVDPINNNIQPWVTGNYSYAYKSGVAFCTSGDCYDLVTQLEDTSSPLRSEVKKYIYYSDKTDWHPSANDGSYDYVYATQL